jgi:hypothetical protein
MSIMRMNRAVDSSAKLLTHDEVRRIAANIAKLPMVPSHIMKEIPSSVIQPAGNAHTNTMIRDQLTIAVVALAISFVAITEVMLSLM